jgi:hypothetical protein
MFGLPQFLCAVPQGWKVLLIRPFATSVRPVAFAEHGDGVDDARERLAGTGHGLAGAQETVHEARFLVQPGAAAGGKDAVAVGLAVGGQRIALRYMTTVGGRPVKSPSRSGEKVGSSGDCALPERTWR